MLGLLIQLVSGAAGGNIAGGLLKNLSQGPLGNTLTGAIGGGIGSQVANTALGLGGAASLANLDPGAIISQIAGGGLGGGAMMILVGILRQAFVR